MAFDLALNLRTGDLVSTPSGDIATVEGPAALLQQVHIALVVPKGKWVLNAELGSRLADSLRSPRWRVVGGEAELAIREALDELDAIELLDVSVEPDTEDSRKVIAKIQFTASGANNVQELTLPLVTGA